MSLYDDKVEVIVRGKANAEVEFGNKLTLVENRVGVIIDYCLHEGNPADCDLVVPSVLRARGRNRDNEGVGVTGLSVRTMRHSWPSTTSRAVYARATQMNCTVG